MPRTKTQSTSPKPLPKSIDNQQSMTFDQAIKYVIAGEKITKREWNNPEYFGVLTDGFLMLHKPDGKLYKWLVSDGDMLGDDWVAI